MHFVLSLSWLCMAYFFFCVIPNRASYGAARALFVAFSLIARGIFGGVMALTTIYS